jgi:hypothetical protein
VRRLGGVQSTSGKSSSVRGLLLFSLSLSLSLFLFSSDGARVGLVFVSREPPCCRGISIALADFGSSLKKLRVSYFDRIQM